MFLKNDNTSQHELMTIAHILKIFLKALIFKNFTI